MVVFWDKRRYQYLLLVVCAVVLVDQSVKYLVRGMSGPVDIIPGILEFTFVQNTGTLWGLFPNTNMLFVIVSIMILSVVVALHKSLANDTWSFVGFSLVTGGALGNIIDRIAHGFVTDFINVHVWPVFNLADSCITVGVVFLAYSMLREEFQKR